MDDFERQLNIEYNKELIKIQNRCKEILEEEIDRQLYDKYEPKTYTRTYQLRDNVETEIRNGELYVYINTGNTHYEDFRGNDVSKYIPLWTNYGHNSSNYEQFMLFQYPTRGYIETSKRRIEQELGVEAMVIGGE